MITYDDLLQICVKYTGPDYYVGDIIPDKKLANARKRYPIPAQERVVALIDTTSFGSAKTGIAIGEMGIYWRNFNIETKKNYLSWHDLASAPIVAKGIVSSRVEAGEDSVLELVGAAFKKDDVVRLLSDIQHLTRSPSTASRSSSTTDTRAQWMVAVSGRQFGPYDFSTLRSMVAECQIDPEKCLVWKEGMLNWSPINQVPDLRALLRQEALHPQMTPPPLPVSATPASIGSPVHERTSEETAFRHARRVGKAISKRVDLNHAPLDDLLSLPEMTLPNSQRVVRERDRRGGFRSVEEVGRFLNLQPHQVERLKERLLIEAYKGRRYGGRIVDF